MKTFSLLVLSLVVVGLSVAGCSKSSPTSSVPSSPYAPGYYTGTFSQIFSAGSTSGFLRFNFEDSSYSYFAIVDKITGSTQLFDSTKSSIGSVSVHNDGYLMFDNNSMMEGDSVIVRGRDTIITNQKFDPQTTFNLQGTFNSTFDGINLHLWQVTPDQTLDFKLTKN